MLSNDPRIRNYNPVNPAVDPLAVNPSVPVDVTPAALAMQNRPAVIEPRGPMTFAPKAVIPERVPHVPENPVITENRQSHNLPEMK